MTTALTLFGKFHPVLVHLPITLLLLGGLAEAVRCRLESPFWPQATRWLFGLGCVAAGFAVASGLILEEHSHHSPDEVRLLEYHENFAIAAAVAALLAFLAQLAFRNTNRPALVWLRRGAAWITTALIVIAGHFGGMAVWGADWFS